MVLNPVCDLFTFLFIFWYYLYIANILHLANPARYRWQVRRLLSTEGGLLLCKSTLRGGEDGESMLPLGFFQFVLFTIVFYFLIAYIFLVF